MQIFLDTFLTLDIFSSHLIKDIWNKNLEELSIQLKNNQIEVISLSYFIEILISKAAYHENISVRRFCLKHLLKNFKTIVINSDYLFGNLMKITNNGEYYRECKSLEQKAKYSPFITKFYVYFIEKFGKIKFISIFFENLLKNIEFLHPFLAYFDVFMNFEIKEELFFIDNNLFEKFLFYINKHYTDFPFNRKIELIEKLEILLKYFIIRNKENSLIFLDLPIFIDFSVNSFKNLKFLVEKNDKIFFQNLFKKNSISFFKFSQFYGENIQCFPEFFEYFKEIFEENSGLLIDSYSNPYEDQNTIKQLNFLEIAFKFLGECSIYKPYLIKITKDLSENYFFFIKSRLNSENFDQNCINWVNFLGKFSLFDEKWLRNFKKFFDFIFVAIANKKEFNNIIYLKVFREILRICSKNKNKFQQEEYFFQNFEENSIKILGSINFKTRLFFLFNHNYFNINL